MERLDALASCVVATQSLVCDKPGSESVMVVSSLLQSVRECGSTVVQSMAVLSGGADGSGSAAVLSALESLRGLSEERLNAVCADEAAAFDMVLDRVCGLDVCFGDEYVSGCMALHTLGCRNGIVLCGRAKFVEAGSPVRRGRFLYVCDGAAPFLLGREDPSGK